MTCHFSALLPIGTKVFNLSILYGLKGKYNLVQWGFEIRLFEGRRISNGPVLNGWALPMAIAIVPTFQNMDYSKSRRFCPDFKWLLTKWLPFIRISNSWASEFQIPFEIQTICNPTSFEPFEIQTRSDYRSPQ